MAEAYPALDGATLRIYGSLFYGDSLTRFGYVDPGKDEIPCKDPGKI